MSQADGGDSLDSPLLNEEDFAEEEQSTPLSQPMGGNPPTAGGGGVTLHGEAVDIRHMFPAGVANSSINQAGEGDSPGTEDITEEDPSQSTPHVSPTSTLSLDNKSSNTNIAPSTMDYMKQTILYLPKKTRLLYYKTRYNVVNFISSRHSSGGLTPVDTSPSSSNDIDPSASYTNINSSNNNNTKTTTRNRITQKSSLYNASSTPLLLKLLIPPLLITNHVLFYHAQTKPMWNLSYKTNVTISATADTLKSKAAADALNVPHHYEYQSHESSVVETFTYMDAIRKLWKGEGLGDAQTISKVAAALLVIFSGIWPHLKLFLVHVCWFVPFVHGMWLRTDGSEDEEGRRCCKCCKSNKQRCTLCCSNGHSHTTHTIRSPFLRTLSTLGKWSLADVLVVCILIAVLHLDWAVHPHEIRAGIEKELPTLLDYAQSKYPDEVQDCTQLLGYTCGRHALVIHFPACLACQGLIKNAYHHPEWTTNEGKDILEGITLDGGGYAQLRVMGMVGTYFFCGAVIMSILLSLVVDMLDEKDRKCVEEDLLDRKRELEFILPSENEGGLGNELELREETDVIESESQQPQEQQPPLNEALLSGEDPTSPNQIRDHAQFLLQASSSPSRLGAPRSRDRHGRNSGRYAALPLSSTIPSPTTNCHLLKQALLTLLSISSLPLVCFAVTLPTMERLVYGGGPTLLHEVLGMIWEKHYSLITLVKTTGDAGGWDTFLMVSFGLFAVVGPILRSVALIVHVLLGLPVALLGDCIEQPRKRTKLRLVLYQATSTLRKTLLPIVDALGAFGCWEVLIVSLIMIQLEIPSITDTIYEDDRCQEADPEHGRTCIEVQFNALDSFLVVVVAWVVLTAASALAMDVALEEDAKSHGIIGLQEEKRYEFGQPIPQRRSNLSRDRAWMGATFAGLRHRHKEGAAGTDNNDGDDGDEYYSPLQQNENGAGGDGGLEQIVFV